MIVATQPQGLGVAPLLVAGGVAVSAAGGAYVWNRLTGLWDSLWLPGSVFGPEPQMPAVPPPPSTVGISTTVDQAANDAANRLQYDLWRRTAMDAVIPGGSPGAPPPPGGGRDGFPWWAWGLVGAAGLVVILGARR